MQKQQKIGQFLLGRGLISSDQLEKILLQQKERGDKFGSIVLQLGLLSEQQFLIAYSEFLGLPYVDLDIYDIDLVLAAELPENKARSIHVILLAVDNGIYKVGAVDPQDIFGLDELGLLLGGKIELSVVGEGALLKAMDRIYRRTDDIHGYAEDLDSELQESTIETSVDGEKEVETAVSHLVRSLFADAVQVDASDIHIEPGEKILRIRQRVDGQLQEQIIDGGNAIAAALAQRLKLMAGLNITEKRLPQDGRFNIKVRKVAVDVRLSTMPIQHGESIVMRLLNQSAGLLNLDNVGMSQSVLDSFRRLIKSPKGMILVTGPTGSGKTTTLYGALNEMNDVAKKFITIEDPVEYRLPRINQVQVRSELGLTFARVLRSTLRQDPDIILVGEIRDLETASIAMRAALTGHLVLATLHTSDAASSAMRLIDMGAEGYLVAATVKAAIAQRLIRKVCSNCSSKYTPSSEEQSFFRKFFPDFDSAKFVMGSGCDHCNGNGYSGRVGVFELLEFAEPMKEALRLGDANSFNKLAQEGQRARSILTSAFDLAKKGETTLSEVLRVAGEQE